MITILGRVIGYIESANVKDLADKVAAFLLNNRQYTELHNVIVKVENVDFLMIKDCVFDYDKKGTIDVLFTELLTDRYTVGSAEK